MARRAGVVTRAREASYEEMNPGSPTIRVTSPRSGVTYSAVDTNLNTNWLENKASWLFYTLLVVSGWLIVSNFVDPGMAWCVVFLQPCDGYDTLCSLALCVRCAWHALLPYFTLLTQRIYMVPNAGLWCIYVTGW
jgi:hypothetical protein